MIPGVFNNITGQEITLAALYLSPVMLIAWFERSSSAFLVAMFSAAAWAISDLVVGHIYANFLYFLVNTLMVLGIYLILAYCLAAVKKLLVVKREH